MGRRLRDRLVSDGMDCSRGAEGPLIIDAVERHVQGAEEEHAPLDADGFLDLGAATGVMPVGDLAGWPGSFVLLAPGGVGKSVVLDDLRRRENGCEVDLVGLRGTEIGQRIGMAIAVCWKPTSATMNPVRKPIPLSTEYSPHAHPDPGASTKQAAASEKNVSTEKRLCRSPVVVVTSGTAGVPGG